MSTTPFTLEFREGRLLEVRIRPPITTHDVRAFAERLRALLTIVAATHKKVVIAVELLNANALPQDVADAFLAVMRYDNPLVERSAFLVGAGALFSMQVEKLIREAANPMRRAFRDVLTLRSWLDESLTAGEQKRLAAFLAK
ncbi:hypothetical protein BH09MYX1_BH09MYX1_22070 [soil metagenome]